MGFGFTKGKSKLDVKELGGIFEGGPLREKAGELGGDIESILQGVQTGGEVGGALKGELLAPSFGPRSDAESALLQSIMSQTQGASALRGLGPSTQGGLAQVLAPALLGLRQQRVQELGTGAGIEQAGRQQALQGLLELLDRASPQIIAGQKSSQSGLNLGFGGGGVG